VIALCALLAAAFVLRMWSWLVLRNMIWPDELFKTLEQAHRAVFGYGVVPWEFREGVGASWILPGMLAGMMTLASTFSSSVTAYLAACAALMSAISLAPLWATFRSAFTEYGLRAAIAATAVCVVWFELVFFAPKALTEVVGGNCLATGVLLADHCVRAHRAGTSPRARTVAIAAALIALAAIFRIQLAIASFVGFVYLLRPLPARLRWFAVGGAFAMVVVTALVDTFTWGYPFQSYISNIYVQIVEGKSKNYGVSPWYAYFEVYAKIWGAGGLVVLALAGLGARRRPILALCAVAVLLTHVPIAHKEYRFAYPFAVPVPRPASPGTPGVIRWLERTRGARLATLGACGLVTLWLAISLQCAVGFHERRTKLALTFSRPQWHWSLHRGGLFAMEYLHDVPDLCGVGTIGTFVYATGGYTYLHRDVPLFEAFGKEDIGGLAPYLNAYILAWIPGIENVESFQGFHRDRCFEEVCVYRRPGPCKVMEGYSFNKLLENQDRFNEEFRKKGGKLPEPTTVMPPLPE